MATVYSRGTGKNKRNYIKFRWTDKVTGQRQQKDYPGEKGETDKQLKKRLAILEGDFARGLLSAKGDRKTFKWVANRFKEYVIKKKASPNTRWLDEKYLDQRIIPFFGKAFIDEIKPFHIEDLMEWNFNRRLDGKSGGRSVEEGKKVSNGTVKKVFSITNQLFTYADKHDYILYNPCNKVDPPQNSDFEGSVMDVNEMALFVDKIRGNKYFDALILSLHTGLRRGEVCALRVQDIDLELCTLSVSKTLIYNQVTKVTESHPIRKNKKKGQGTRTISIDPTTAIMLRKYIDEKNYKRIKAGIPKMKKTDAIFSHLDGTYLHPDVLGDNYRKCIKGTPLEGFRLHDLRHTHATWVINLTKNPLIAQQRLGHHSPAFTLERYGHNIQGLDKEVSEEFSEKIRDAFDQHEKEKVSQLGKINKN
tara:strand:- start:8888 stop:10144 length:1257 start_codon:yes stop_codon:yes gene_type:complete